MLSSASCNSSRVLAPEIRKRWEFNKPSFVAQKCRSLLIYIATTERNRMTSPLAPYLPLTHTLPNIPHSSPGHFVHKNVDSNM
jgi:hypothetical protein